MGSFEAFTFAFRERGAGVALVDVRAARDGGEPVEGGRRDCVVYEKEPFSYVGEGPQLLDCRHPFGTR